MRIPVLDGPRVDARPVGTPYSTIDQHAGGDIQARALSELGANVAQVSDIIEKARQRADGVAVNDALTKLQGFTTSTLHGDEEQPGFLASKGMDAQAQRSIALDSLRKKSEELEGSLSSEPQKRLFRQHSAQLLNSGVTQVESHVQQQRRTAEIASLDGRAAVMLTDIANNYADDAQVAEKSKAMEQTIRAFEAPIGDADAKVGEWRSKVAQTRLNQFLAARDWRGAQALFAQVKGELGPAGTTIEKQISTMREDMQAETTAAQLVEKARDSDPLVGRVDSAKAMVELEKIHAGPARDEARQRLEHRLNVEDGLWKQKVDVYVNRALSGYSKAGGLVGINPADKAWLETNASEEWLRIRDRARRDVEAAHARQRGERLEETDAEREALLRVRVEMEEDPERYRAMSPEEFTSKWQTELSDSGFKEAGRVFAGVKKEPKGTASEFYRFVDDQVKGDDGLSRNRQEQGFFRAFMGDKRRAFILEKKREPTLDEVNGFREQAFELLAGKSWRSWIGLQEPKSVPAYKAAAQERKKERTEGTAPRTPVPPGLELGQPRKARTQRIQELKASGVSREQAEKTLQAEGY